MGMKAAGRMGMKAAREMGMMDVVREKSGAGLMHGEDGLREEETEEVGIDLNSYSLRNIKSEAKFIQKTKGTAREYNEMSVKP